MAFSGRQIADVAFDAGCVALVACAIVFIWTFASVWAQAFATALVFTLLAGWVAGQGAAAAPRSNALTEAGLRSSAVRRDTVSEDEFEETRLDRLDAPDDLSRPRPYGWSSSGARRWPRSGALRLPSASPRSAPMRRTRRTLA